MNGIRHFSLEEQARLYKQALKLREEHSWGKRRIARVLGISEDTVSGWLYRGYSTLNRFNNFEIKSSYELGYIIGTVWGDGNLYFDKTKGRYGGNMVRLGANDLDFINEFNRCLCTLLNKKKPYTVIKMTSGILRVECSCKSLYDFLNQNLVNQKTIIEGTTESMVGFLKAFFDGEGGCYYKNKTAKTSPKVRCYNTDLELLEYVNYLLSQFFGIYSSIRMMYDQGQYGNRKAHYGLEISRYNDIVKYHTLIGFSIKRKQERLEEIVKWIEAR